MKFALAMLVGCTPSPPPLLVLAPRSTQVPVERLVRDWATSQGTEATVVFDDSAALARMVDGGTPADLLLLSDPARMAALEARQHLAAGTRARITADEIAVLSSIVANRPASDLPSLGAQAGTIWLPPADSAEAEAAGRLLREAGSWEQLAPRIHNAHDEATVLQSVLDDPTAVGMLAAGRASLSANISIDFLLPRTDAPLPLEAAVVAHADRPDTARMLLSFLQSPEAEAPFRARGFRGSEAFPRETRPKSDLASPPSPSGGPRSEDPREADGAHSPSPAPPPPVRPLPGDRPPPAPAPPPGAEPVQNPTRTQAAEK